MFKYTFKIFLRNLSRRKLFSLINISGLAFGIAFILLIGQFLFHETGYNSGISNIENIYRLVDSTENDYNIDYRIRDQILESIPGVKNAALLNHFGVEVNEGNKIFQVKHMLVVDQNFFEIFKVKFISGSQEDALISIDDVVLTETTAKRIFGRTDVIGKTLLFGHEHNLIIKGVVEDLPEDISFTAELFVSELNSHKQRLGYKMGCLTYDGKDDSQCKYPFNVFVELESNANIATIEKQISGFNKLNTYRYPSNVKLEPLKSNYFNTSIQGSDLLHGNVELVKILAVIGIIILLLAIINFINLATASYRSRLTEIGVKKCLGLNRPSLIKQLLMEALFTCTASSIIGVILSELFLPYFSRFVDKDLTLQIFSSPVFFVLFISFILLLSILAGFFPSLVMSKISPLELFKFNSYLKGTGKTFRNFLTMFQFAITIVLISGLIIISSQIDFVKHKNLGFNSEQLIYLKVGALGNRIKVVSDKLEQYHNVSSVTHTLGIPGEVYVTADNHQVIYVDSASVKTFGFKLIRGRDLLPGDINDACLINETAFKKMERDFSNKKVNGSNIAGVVSDFHYSSLYTETQPLALIFSNAGVTHISMRISGNVGETINYIEKMWKEICPDYQLDYGFYDDHFAMMYQKEENFASLVSIFSVLAVVISCMGIFGLSVFQAEQRIKEIGIRKVFGATPFEIVKLLSGSSGKWVLLANIIAWPAAYYIMNKWLENFAYRIEISWWMFVIAGFIALVIAVLTVSWQSVKAALANPVKSLKYE